MTDKTETMVERVASSIYDIIWPTQDWDQHVCRAVSEAAARAAIEAWRKPTMAMLQAAKSSHEGDFYLPHSLLNAMIDAALSEPQP